MRTCCSPRRASRGAVRRPSRFSNTCRRTKIGCRLDPLQGLDEEQWLKRTRAAAPLAVVEREWRGVYSSMANLFPACLPAPDGLTKRSAARVADLIVQTGASHVVLAELPETYSHLLGALEQTGRKINVYAMWYNSFMMSSARPWKPLVPLKQLVAEKRIKKICFAKSGMADVFNRLAVSSSFVLHAMAQTPSAASVPLPCGPHLGIAAVNLSIWRKLPFAMLAAAAEIQGAVVHVADATSRVEDFVRVADPRRIGGPCSGSSTIR
jgi:hypothetical protein